MIDWKQVYKKLLLERAYLEKPNGQYTELHHILPRYQGGTDLPENLARLSIKDHTLAHYILWRWQGNLQDRVAYLMKGGQTEKGNMERLRLAREASIEVNRERFLTNNPSKDPSITRKAKQTKVLRYDGGYHSEEGLQQIRLLCNSGGQHTPEAIEKRAQSVKQTKASMSDQEYFDKYVAHSIGEGNSNYGKKRPGELAGNFGTSKGTYTLIAPDGTRIEFKGITKLIQHGVGETVIRNWRNRGAILPQPNNKRSPWIGYQIEYRANPKYGHANKKAQKTKRKLK
jgi:hypothetical protein